MFLKQNMKYFHVYKTIFGCKFLAKIFFGPNLAKFLGTKPCFWQKFLPKKCFWRDLPFSAKKIWGFAKKKIWQNPKTICCNTIQKMLIHDVSLMLDFRW